MSNEIGRDNGASKGTTTSGIFVRNLPLLLRNHAPVVPPTPSLPAEIKGRSFIFVRKEN